MLTLLVIAFSVTSLSVAESIDQTVLNAPLKALPVTNSSHQNNSCKHTPYPLLAKRGCCSRHKGVCGCTAGGRTTCCDGTVSPSCTCNALADQAATL